MTKPHDGGPAFPEPERIAGDGRPLTEDHGYRQPGMSLRDYFAGQALTGLMLAPLSDTLERVLPIDEWVMEDFAVEAYRLADAMLAERAKGGA